MTQDRNYLRMLSDSELVRTALDRNHELAVVLAERLAELLDVEDQLEDAKKEIVELNDRLDRWMEEANDLQAQLDVIDIE
jgi:predicted nuclease with TOPRIM domain